jgi:glycosyltransferase involved in cell wall biosynthesis
VPPGVGEPFTSQPLDGLDGRAGTYCVAVGLHDRRKRIDFLVALWPEVRRRTGLELHIATRSTATTTVATSLDAVDGVVVHHDPDDDALARLYAGALCLLWPSSYEGYGFPLLEAMATGTPFLATDVGAAAELAVDVAQQVLEPAADRWVTRIAAWHEGGVTELRRASAAKAHGRSWDATADLTAELIAAPES